MKKTITELKKVILDKLCNGEDSDQAINDVLAMVGEYFGVDRAYIIENSEDNLYCNNTFEWCNKGIQPEIHFLQKVRYEEDLGIPADYFFRQGDLFLCKDISELTPKTQNILKQQNITGVLFCAIRVHNKLRGYVGFDNCSEGEAKWVSNQDAIETLEYTAHLMTLSIMDYRRKAELIASKDAELQIANNKLEDILSNVNSGIVIYRVHKDQTIAVEYVNEYVSAMVGGTKEEVFEIVQKDCLAIINEEYRELFKSALRRAVRDGSSSVVYEVTGLDGSMKSIKASFVSSYTDSEDIFVHGTFNDITEEKNAQKRLNESAEIVAAALRSADAMVWIYDMEDRKIIGKAASMKQHRFGEVIDNAPESIIERGYVHPDYVDSYRKLFETACKSKTAVQGDFLVQNSDATGYMWNRVIIEPRNEKGKITTAIGTSINISAWKKKESQYQKLLDEMASEDDGKLIAKGRYNLSLNRILFYKRKSSDSLELDEKSTFDNAMEEMLQTTISPVDRETLQKMLDRKTLLSEFAIGHTEGEFEYKRIQNDGPAYWSKLKYTLFEEPYSHDVMFFVYTYDITESVREKCMLEKLGATEYDVLGLIDIKTHQFESKSIKGIKSLIDSKNRYVKGLFEDVIHQQILATVRDNEREELERKLTLEEVVKQLETLSIFSIAFSAIRHDQTRTRKQMNFTYLDETKTTIFYYCTDITSMYDREQEQLQRTEDALETAKVASKSKTEFFSRMSHDMRTPMNGILGLTALSQGETDVNVLQDNIKKIDESGHYLLSLINDTLDIQRIESGKMVLEPAVINTVDVVNNILDMVQSTAKEKGVNLKYDSGNADLNWYIRMDSLRLKQIFVNLLSNAIKFTPSGGTVELEFKLLQREGMISHDVVYVRDTGIGMSEEFLKNEIFKPFSQEHNFVSEKYAGSGLGLSIAKRLVEMMGGKIEVESELGVGTTFAVYLDFERVNETEVKESIQSHGTQMEDLLVKIKGKNILLVEDHPLNAEIAKRLLEKGGCNVTWQDDGSKAVDCVKDAKENAFDLILMDVRMPVMDGLEAAKTIRALSRKDSKQVPIIAMTANAYEEDVKNCLEAGMNGHLGKPVEPQKLYETIANYV